MAVGGHSIDPLTSLIRFICREEKLCRSLNNWEGERGKEIGKGREQQENGKKEHLALG